MSLSKTNQIKVSLQCYATVSGLFATMHNPKMRGANFSWEKFAEMASRQCRTQVFMNIPSKSDKQEAELLAHAERTGHEIATYLVAQMTEA